MRNERSAATKTKSLLVILLFAAAAVASVMTAGKISINYNLADYLGKDTQTRVALDIMEDEFGLTGNLQVMVKGISADTADDLCDRIGKLPNVLTVNFDRWDEACWRDGSALFGVVVDGDDYSENAAQVTTNVRELLAGYEAEYGGTVIEKQSLRDSITSEMVYILALALGLVVVILLLTSASWLEPLILLAASGVAVLLNRGTNFFFGEISYITNSISAILQLALSIDYSIVLLHAYRKEKERTPDSGRAMKKAIRSVVSPVSASALTTIAGLLALLFMSFRIGFDIGIVLMKGIVISALTSLSLLPALVLLFDGAMTRTAKPAFAPKGRGFRRLAVRFGAYIVPGAMVLILTCGIIQTANSYLFSDTKAGNPVITDAFGNHNSVAVIYPNSADGYANEERLAAALRDYRTAGGAGVLSGYTAYSNTVRETYDVTKAVQKLGIGEADARMLFTMYNLYRAPDSLQLSFADFMAFANTLAATDADAMEFVDADTLKTLQTVQAASDILAGEWTAAELQERLTTGAMEGNDIDLFSVRQLYGLYFYDRIAAPTVDFRTMLQFLLAASEDSTTAAMFAPETVQQLRALADGIAQFEDRMQTLMTQAMLQGYVYQNTGTMLSEAELAQLWGAYFLTTGETPAETIPLLPLLTFMVGNGFLTDSATVQTVQDYAALDGAIRASYPYEAFLPALAQIAAGLTGVTPQLSASAAAIRQMYILWFIRTGAMPDGAIVGREFVAFALLQDSIDPVIHAALTDANCDRLADLQMLDGCLSDTTARSYTECAEVLTGLQGAMRSDLAQTEMDADKVSGVYIKYAVQHGLGLTDGMMAFQLLDFVDANMDTNRLLREKMTAENRAKVIDAKADIAKAEDLFCGDRYGRMLVTVDLPNESEDTTAFVGWLSDEAKAIFGGGACITGEIVSTYDLEQSFGHDNRFITVFTLISIFVIVMVVFRSLSLPIILVMVIQGAIFIAMSTQVGGSGVFFMSYIVSTCILMGATIDYGILMSSTYVAERALYEPKHALRLAVETAMPTVFTSGMILTVCGFVIHFVSSQNSISTVGLLIGIGTICSVVMITVVLPAILCLWDPFVVRFSARRKPEESADEQTQP